MQDGSEDFELTLLYGSRTKKDILFWDVLDAFQQCSNGKVEVVHVLSGEEYTFFNSSSFSWRFSCLPERSTRSALRR